MLAFIWKLMKFQFLHQKYAPPKFVSNSATDNILVTHITLQAVLNMTTWLFPHSTGLLANLELLDEPLILFYV